MKRCFPSFFSDPVQALSDHLFFDKRMDKFLFTGKGEKQESNEYCQQPLAWKKKHGKTCKKKEDPKDISKKKKTQSRKSFLLSLLR